MRRTSLKRSPLRKQSIASSSKNPKLDIEIIQDHVANEQRVILRGDAWEAERTALFLEAKGQCEGCEPPHACLHGDAHHLYGRSAGKRHDQVWFALADGTRRRCLLWVCRLAHDTIHRTGIRKWREEHAGLLNCLAQKQAGV